MEQSRSESKRDSTSSDAVASLSSIAGALAVIVYTVIATARLLSSDGGENPFGTIFFLILGAVVIFFLTAILVAGLAGLLLNLSRRLEPSRGGEGGSEARSQESPGEDAEGGEASRLRQPGR